MKSFYSRLGFKVIKHLARYPNFKEDCKRFNYESGTSKSFQKKPIGLQCHQTIPLCVKILYDNQIDFNENRNLFKILNEVPPSDDWFPYKYIDDEVEKIIYKTKGQLTGDEMEKGTKNYVESLNHDPNWLTKISIEIDKFLINREDIDFFMKMYMQWSKNDGSTLSFRKLIITHLPHLEKLALS